MEKCELMLKIILLQHKVGLCLHGHICACNNNNIGNSTLYRNLSRVCVYV